MNPSTGTFTSMDTYQGSTFDPITLHKYLYANANPVMNCDPSGYMSIGEMSATMGMIGALSSGLISIGMNILRNLDETGEFKCTLSVQELMFSMLFGYVAGATFGGALYWAAGLKFAAVGFAILGSLSLVKASIQYFYTGEKWQAGGNLFLSILSFVGAFKLAHQYDVIVKANDTAKTATDNSTSNTNTVISNPKDLKSSSPIKIPNDANVTIQSKVGYDQVRFKWSADGYKYEARWHTRTPGAPSNQGNTWVITRTTPGTASGQFKVQHILTQNGWVTMSEWQAAVAARQNGTATPEQQQLLTSGHWPG